MQIIQKRYTWIVRILEHFFYQLPLSHHRIGHPKDATIRHCRLDHVHLHWSFHRVQCRPGSGPSWDDRGSDRTSSLRDEAGFECNAAAERPRQQKGMRQNWSWQSLEMVVDTDRIGSDQIGSDQIKSDHQSDTHRLRDDLDRFDRASHEPMVGGTKNTSLFF